MVKIVIMVILYSITFSKTSIALDERITQVAIENSSQTSISGNIQLGDIDYKSIIVDKDEYTQLILPGYHNSNLIGSPELPEIHTLIEIPYGAYYEIQIKSKVVESYNLEDYSIRSPIYPHQPSLSKSLNVNQVEFQINKDIYNEDQFIVNELINLDLKGQLRSLNLANLIIRPIDYNPIKGIIEVVKEIEFEISFIGADVIKSDHVKQTYYSPYFESVYRQIENYDSKINDDLVDYPVTYVIITNPIFLNTLTEFVEWKTKKGFHVLIGNTAEIGSSTSAIKNYIEDLYNSPADGMSPPSFVLFVGDVAQVPTYSGSTGSHVTDLYYVEMTGDMIPDIYRGRFSAQNISQLESQISKTLEYERYEMPDPSYLEEVLMVSGVDGSFAATHGNGQINYGNDYYFNEDHGIYSHTYLYPESDGSGVAAAIIQDYNEGVGFANYTAHCSSAGWADPSFTTSDVPGLYNEHEYNLMIGNCCTSVAFDVESFGEVILRAENSGAVGYIGGTNSTYWDEDYWWGVGSGAVSANPIYEQTGLGIYDGIFHENGEDEHNWYVVNDAINMSGNLAVAEAGGMDDYYWEIYHNMGDPSLMTYMGVPSQNNVDHMPILQIGTNSFYVSADPYSHIAISMDGILYGSVYLGSNSSIEMDILPFSTAGTADIIVTGQNKQPYFGTIEVGNAEGPYVVIDEFSVASSDGDDIIEYGETISVSMALKNVGNELTESIQVALTADDQYIAIINNYNTFENLSPEQITYQENAFSFLVDPAIPNDYLFVLNVSIQGSGRIWNYSLNLKAFAPVLSFEGVLVEDSDGQLDPGDTKNVGIDIYNSGGSSLNGVNIFIYSSDEYININGDNSYFLENLDSESHGVTYYSFSADPETPIGYIATFDILVSASGPSIFEESLVGSITVGLTWEDFESGTFSNLPWSFSGNSDWEIVNQSYEGTYAAASGSIDDNEISELNININVISEEDVTFFYKVSSESSYDYLRFYIDGIEKDSWSGEIDWSQASYTVSTGEHQLRWIYSKDGSVDSGSDMAWVDYIVFPPIGTPAFPEMDISVDQLEVLIENETQITEQFIIQNQGEGDLQYNMFVVLDSPESDMIYESIKLDKGELDPREGSLQMRGLGGPDAFGYTWIDSDEVGGPDPTWIEIDYCGIPIGTGDDSNEGPFELGFPFYFYGNEYNSVRVSTNGFLSFTSTATSYTNQLIPSNSDPNALIAPFWDDLNPNNGGQMYYFPWGDHFVVQWDEIPLYSGNGSQTFQVVLYSDGRILFNYQTVTSVNSCTVGIENESGSDGLQVVFDNNYLHDGLTIEFSSDFLQPWLTIFPQSGIISTGNQSIISASFDSEGLSDGTYSGNINVYSNDPDVVFVQLPVTMLVGAECNTGDLNNDGDISILDIIKLINCILDDECGTCYDINGDSGVNIQDIIVLINLILE